MTLTVQPEAPPLRLEDTGAIRVGDTRVLLEVVIHTFRKTPSPDEIVRQFPTLSLQDVYGVIAFYLRHQAEVDDYVAERDRIGDEYERQTREQNPDLKDLRARLEARRNCG